jgi:hypothetical protein
MGTKDGRLSCYERDRRASMRVRATDARTLFHAPRPHDRQGRNISGAASHICCALALMLVQRVELYADAIRAGARGEADDVAPLA